MCVFGIKLIAFEINSYLTAEPVIVANAQILILSSGVCPTKAFPVFKKTRENLYVCC